MRLLLGTVSLVSALAALAFHDIGNWFGGVSNTALQAARRRAGRREAR